jgi:hypothetical protein
MASGLGAPLELTAYTRLGVVGVDSKSASYVESDEPPLIREHGFFSKLHLNLAGQRYHFNFDIFGNITNYCEINRISTCNSSISSG